MEQQQKTKTRRRRKAPAAAVVPPERPVTPPPEQEIAIDCSVGSVSDVQTRENIRLSLTSLQLDRDTWPFAIAPAHSRWKEFLALYTDPSKPPPEKFTKERVLDNSLSICVNGIILPINLYASALAVHHVFATKLAKGERRICHDMENYLQGATNSRATYGQT